MLYLLILLLQETGMTLCGPQLPVPELDVKEFS